jgi:hypothetical protein
MQLRSRGRGSCVVDGSQAQAAPSVLARAARLIASPRAWRRSSGRDSASAFSAPSACWLTHSCCRHAGPGAFPLPRTTTSGATLAALVLASTRSSKARTRRTPPETIASLRQSQFPRPCPWVGRGKVGLVAPATSLRGVGLALPLVVRVQGACFLENRFGPRACFAVLHEESPVGPCDRSVHRIDFCIGGRDRMRWIRKVAVE